MSSQDTDLREKARGNPYPERGLIKKKIAKDIIEKISNPFGNATGEEKSRDRRGGHGSTTTSKPPSHSKSVSGA
ncbi:hypothetical protein AAC387_Pa05g3620 [Persea americana]